MKTFKSIEDRINYFIQIQKCIYCEGPVNTYYDHYNNKDMKTTCSCSKCGDGFSKSTLLGDSYCSFTCDILRFQKKEDNNFSTIYVINDNLGNLGTKIIDLNIDFGEQFLLNKKEILKNISNLFLIM